MENIEDKMELEQITTEDVRDAICELLYENMADDIKVLKITDISSLADYFIIATAKSPNHLRSLANEIQEVLAYNGLKANHIEGLKGLKWVLMDYTDVVVHIFLPQARDYYGLESYWADAPLYKYDPENDKPSEEE
ncbi:MAG: ribosome silencing factor [Candidatus Zixiibacteriota bacterium]